MNLDNVSIFITILLLTLSITTLTAFLANLKNKKNELQKKEFMFDYDLARKNLEKEIMTLERELQKTESNTNRLIFEGQKNYKVKKNEKTDNRNLLYLTPFTEEYVTTNVDMFKGVVVNFSQTSKVVEETVTEIGFNFLRSDRETASNIFDHIIQLMEQSQFIIVNIDGRNPNVFYELGYSHGLNKDTILISHINEEKKVPFDIRNQRIIFYTDYKDLQSKLRLQLGNKLFDRLINN